MGAMPFFLRFTRETTRPSRRHAVPRILEKPGTGAMGRWRSPRVLALAVLLGIPCSCGGLDGSKEAGPGGGGGGGGAAGGGGRGGTGGTGMDAELQTVCRIRTSACCPHLLPTGNTCSVLVRIDASCTEVIGFQLNCGDGTNGKSEVQARGALSSCSGVDWQTEPLVSSPADTGIYAFESAGPTDTLAVVSAATGNELTCVAMGMDSYIVPDAWFNGSEIDGVCPDEPAVPFSQFGTLDALAVPEQAVELLRRRGLFSTLLAGWGTPGDYVAVTQVALSTGKEYLVVITAYMRS